MTAPALAAGVAVLGVAGGAYLGGAGFGGTSTADAPLATRLHVLVSAESAPEPVVRVARPVAPRSQQVAPERITVNQQLQPAKVHVAVAKDPLHSGKTEEHQIRVPTPIGTIVVDGDYTNEGKPTECVYLGIDCGS